MKFLRFLFRRLIPLGCLACILFLIVNAIIPDNSTRIEGVGVDLLSSPPYTSENVNSQLDALEQAGVKFVQIEMNWSTIEVSQGVYNWSAAIPLDTFLTSAKQRGMTTVVVLTGEPYYLFMSGSTIDQQLLEDRWEAYIQAAVEHFGKEIDIWQIGYQINSNTSFFPSLSTITFQPNAELYSKLLTTAAKIIKRGDPNDKVWVGSLVSATAGTCAMNPLTYLMEIDSANGWRHVDAITYQPIRGAAAPESAAAVNINPACSSATQADLGSLSGEVKTIQDLAQQLGRKQVYVTGVNWSDEELAAMQSNRSIEKDQLKSDLLLRASLILMGRNEMPLVFWQMDPTNQATVATSLTNINSQLHNATVVGQAQTDSGWVQEYRFQKFGKQKIMAWCTQNGDSLQTVTFSNLELREWMGFSMDSVILSNTSATAIRADDGGTSSVTLNERPMVFIGKPDGIQQQLKQALSDQADLVAANLSESIARGLNDAKTALIDILRDQAELIKEKAVNWGKQRSSELFN